MERPDAARRLDGGLVHDFNHMLAVIMGASEMLARDLAGDEKGRALALMALDAAERGTQLVRRMLVMAKGHAPGQDQFDAAECLDSVRRFAEFLTPKGVQVAASAPTRPLRLTADRAGLEAALMNLCVNAGDAMPAGGLLSLAVRRRRLAGARAEALGVAPGWYAAFEASDTGEGMAPEALAHAADRGFTTKAGQGGSGLGLALVRQFAQDAGGALTIASRRGLGTRVVIYLPLQAEA
jgi:signal transduction histidine kinase